MINDLKKTINWFFLGPNAEEILNTGNAMRIATLNFITFLGSFYILIFFGRMLFADITVLIYIIAFIMMHAKKGIKYFDIIKIVVILDTMFFFGLLYLYVMHGDKWVFLIPFMVIFVMELKWGVIFSLFFLTFMFAVEFFVGKYGWDSFARYACIFFAETALVSIYNVIIDFYNKMLLKDKERIEYLSITDHLTKLYNRRYFSEISDREFALAIRKKEYLCFLMIDVDKFKKYNDTYGHLQGDALLVLISKTLKEIVKRSSDLVFRMGGEEFGILLSNTDCKGGFLVAENIRTAVGEMKIPLLDGNGETKITVSIGLACLLPSVGDNMENLLKIADSNLYKAKAEGRNRVIF